MVDIEQQVSPALIVGHVSVLQVLVAYFRNTPVENCTSIALPMNTVLKFTPSKGKCISSIHLIYFNFNQLIVAKNISPSKGGGWQESQHCILNSDKNAGCDVTTTDSDSYFHDTPTSEWYCSPLTRSITPPFNRESKDALPDVVSPLAAPPIWGDHGRGSVLSTLPSENI